jgi:hypothetical protein
MNRLRLSAATAASAALLGSLAPMAPASEGSAFGRHVASCAQEHLGQRAAPPAVVCTMPDGTTMTFATFGAMVQHMRSM